MVPAIEGYDMGGRECPGVGEFIQGSGAGSPTIWVRGVGGVPTHQDGSGRILTLGDIPNYGAADESADGWELGLTAFVGGGIGGVGYVCYPHP